LNEGATSRGKALAACRSSAPAECPTLKTNFFIIRGNGVSVKLASVADAAREHFYERKAVSD